MRNKRGNSIFTIILEIVIVLAIIGIGFAIYYTMTDDSMYQKSEENDTTNNQVSRTSNNISETDDKNKTKVLFNGYEFKISEDKYVYTIDGNNLQVEAKNGNFGIQFNVVDLNYDNLENDKTALAYSLGLTDGSDLEIIEKKIANINYKCLEIDLFGMKYIIAYSKLSDSKILATTVMNESYTIDYDALEEATEVVKTVKKEN